MSAAMMSKALTSESTTSTADEVNQAEQIAVATSPVGADPEVEPKTDRRQFTPTYKRSIVEQAERCQGEGEIGALLRREGLYSSHLSNWRRAQREGTLGATKARRRGPSAAVDAGAQREIARLKAQNQRLEHELEKARTIIDVQKKLSALLSLNPNGDKSS